MATISDLTQYLSRPTALQAASRSFRIWFLWSTERNASCTQRPGNARLGRDTRRDRWRKLNPVSSPLAERHSRFIQQVFRTGEIVVTETHQELHKTPVWIDSAWFAQSRGRRGAGRGRIIRDVSVRVRAQEALANARPTCGMWTLPFWCGEE